MEKKSCNKNDTLITQALTYTHTKKHWKISTTNKYDMLFVVAVVVIVKRQNDNARLHWMYYRGNEAAATAIKSQRSKANGMNMKAIQRNYDDMRLRMWVCVCLCLYVCKSLKMHVFRLLQCIWEEINGRAHNISFADWLADCMMRIYQRFSIIFFILPFVRSIISLPLRIHSVFASS